MPAQDNLNTQEKIFKILCIDGGGMKGIFSTSVLERLEESIKAVKSDDNVRLVDYFDMICGTSTGGLIALALAIGKPASEISAFYAKYGAKIFPERLQAIKKARLATRGAQYDNAHLREALRKFYGDLTISDSRCLLCIPSYCLQEGKGWIFRYDHKTGKLGRDNGCTLVDAGMATTAAPTYLPKVQLSKYSNFQFIDGGIFANNPSLVGITEALRYFVGEGKTYTKLRLLSVASLNENAAEEPELPINQNIYTLSKQTARAMLAAQSASTDFMAETILESLWGKGYYVRIPSDAVGHRQEPAIQLDAATDLSIKFMRGKGLQQGLIYAKKPEVQSFFSEHKTFILNDNG